ncbi:MAG: hypothetical protein CFE40_04635 [Burkholderiales bacterium PBB1]|nr:MAG: hypothetical protein CFE40_04635 [Burkholderiales bacterium PBB1]
MKLRVLFLLMTLVLVWSSHVADRPVSASVSISEHARHGDWATALTQPSVGAQGDPASTAQVVPAAEEAVVDLVGLLPPGANSSVSALSMTWPGPYATRVRTSPYLDGPQRPPRGTHLLA